MCCSFVISFCLLGPLITRLRLLQARKATVEAELSTTKAELQELRLRQQQLETRNLLLERVAELNNADSNQLSAQASRSFAKLLSFCASCAC